MYQYLYAEGWFAGHYPTAVRAPVGSPYDFGLPVPLNDIRQVEVKGVSTRTSDGCGRPREGRVFVDVESHQALKLMPNPWYCIVVYNGECHPHWLSWAEMDKLINTYKSFVRSEPDGRVAVKIALHRIIEATG